MILVFLRFLRINSAFTKLICLCLHYKKLLFNLRFKLNFHRITIIIKQDNYFMLD
jgi:hypothetical protein